MRAGSQRDTHGRTRHGPRAPGGRGGSGTLVCGLAAFLALLLPSAGRAERDLGLELARESRCEPALAELAPVVEQDPNDAEAWLVIGSCESQLGRHAAAEQALLRARALDPDLPGLDLRVGVARYHLGDLDGAQRALDAAGAGGDGGGELRLYRGLVQFERAAREGDAEGQRAAARLLESAAEADPAAVEPVASYYAASAWAGAGEVSRAKALFESVANDWPDSQWARQSREAIDRIDPRRVWASAEAGFEHDSNVVLRGAGVVLPQDISNEQDIRGVLRTEAGGEWLSRGPFTAGARIAYEGRWHQDLHDFDSQFPNGSVWLDYRLRTRSLLRGQYVYGYAWVGGDPFVSVNRLLGSWIEDFADYGTLTLTGELYDERYFFHYDDVPDGPGRVGAPCASRRDVLCAPPGIDERHDRNRSGSGYVLRVEHRFVVPLREAEIALGYEFDSFDSRGPEWSYRAHEVRADARLLLPFGVGLSLGVSYTYRPFQNATSFPEPTGLVFNRQYGLATTSRREHMFQAAVALEREIMNHVVVSLRWDYTKNDSTAPVFEYDRHVVGAYVTVGWGAN